MSSGKKDSLPLVIPLVEKGLLVERLTSLMNEAEVFAEYMSANIPYRKAVGYAEGRKSAYSDILCQILCGEFDPDISEEGDSDGEK